MPILACVLPALTFLCQPALDALQACVGNQAQSFFTFLASWAGGLFARCWEGPGVELPELASEVVGAEETLSEIRSHLRDDSAAGIIGIYGMGGVGKSTILRRIHNELLESGSRRGSFDLMIWVTVSRTVNISQIQKQIADRLGLSLPDSCTDEEKNAGVLFKVLSEKRFLVLLDDLWEALDLQVKIGIPSPKKRRNSKIVLTTRSSQVCCDMDADKMVEVKPLDKDPSWELFCSKLLRTKKLVRNSPTIRQLAQQVVRRCGGLPLALVTVGRAMANKMLRPEWEHALEALDHCAEQLHGMEEVLGCLKFSYDNLKNDKMRSALLLCAMYPEDDDIVKEEIILLWFGEGMLDDGGAAGGSIDGARNRGHVLISQLQDACLLEHGMLSPLQNVRMHDAVRDMGRWLNSHEYNNVDGFLVCDGGRARDNTTGADQSPERVKRIRMRGIDLDQLLEEETSNLLKYYPCNRTLVLTEVQGLGPSVLQEIAGFMKTTLRVLDLSDSDVEELPGEVGLMVELRYLELGFTRIKTLPIELGNLVKLRILRLRFLRELQSIPREAMAGLSSLQLLDMFGTSYDWEAADYSERGGGGGGGRQLSLGDLELGLRRLEELNI